MKTRRRWRSSAAVTRLDENRESRTHDRLPTIRHPTLLVYFGLARTPIPGPAILHHIHIVDALQAIPEHEYQGRFPAPHDQLVVSIW